VVTKNELASAVEFDWDAARTSIQSVRPGMQIFRLSAKTGEGMEEYLTFLSQQLAQQRAVAQV
jgi:hydrogenase nickel incorporation protein HypB